MRKQVLASIVVGVLVTSDAFSEPAIRRVGNPSEVAVSPASQIWDRSQAMEVVATGIGANPDKAIQAAFSQAIEQTVGVLVDAETLINNDQILREQILTFSRGFVREYKVVRQWQQDGLSYAQIRALVETTKLTEKLKANKIAAREVPGDLVARQISFDAKNEEQAAEMFGKVLSGYDMTKLTKVEIVGKPEITRDGANARLAVRINLSPDLAQWDKFSRDLRLVLTKAATRRAGLAAGMDYRILARQLEGRGVLVGLFKTCLGGRNQWELFRVPESMEWAIRQASSPMRYRLTCLLLDDLGNEVVRTTVMESGNRYIGLGELIPSLSMYPLGEIWWVGPIWLRRDECEAFIETDTTVLVSQEDLSRVVKAVAFLEAGAGDSRPRGSGEMRPGGSGDMRPGGSGDMRPGGSGDMRPGGSGDMRPGGSGEMRPGGSGDMRPGGSGDMRPGGSGEMRPGGSGDLRPRPGGRR